jgi:hypothetical protein
VRRARGRRAPCPSPSRVDLARHLAVREVRIGRRRDAWAIRRRQRLHVAFPHAARRAFAARVAELDGDLGARLAWTKSTIRFHARPACASTSRGSRARCGLRG